MWSLPSILMLIVTLTSTTSSGSYPHAYKPIETKDIPIDEDVGEPLIITPYLTNKFKIQEAREKALVTIEEFASVPSYTGFFTVDEIFNSNMFFWFIPSQGDFENDPVLLWLEGGQGESGLYGLFGQHGPFVVSKGDQLSFREYSWTRNHSVIYIDSPAETGFSFTNGGLAENQTKVGEDLYEALIQFFTLFAELQDNPFFVIGESYAGKYIPALGYTIHNKNPSAELKINLQGLLIGNGLTDPETQIVEYGNYLYQIGLIDENTQQDFNKYQVEAVQYIRQGEFVKALFVMDIMFLGQFNQPSLFEKATGFTDYFNYLNKYNEDSSYEGFVQTAAVRKAIHVGNVSYSSPGVQEALEEDIMQSVAPWVSELLSHYKVLFFNGQLDIIVAYPLTVNFLRNLEFNGAEDYKTAPRDIWRVGEEVAGYVTVAGNLTEVLVRDAGHVVALDRPKWAYDLVYKSVRGIPLA